MFLQPEWGTVPMPVINIILGILQPAWVPSESAEKLGLTKKLYFEITRFITGMGTVPMPGIKLIL